MPIYAYRCENCGFAKDVLQKISDPLLTVCPNCGHDTFRKQVTAAGFQLKGSGWYVTDFRDKPATSVPPVRSDADGASSSSSSDNGKPADAKPSDAKPANGSAPAPSSSGDAKPAGSPAPAPAPKPDKPSSTS